MKKKELKKRNKNQAQSLQFFRTLVNVHAKALKECDIEIKGLRTRSDLLLKQRDEAIREVERQRKLLAEQERTFKTLREVIEYKNNIVDSSFEKDHPFRKEFHKSILCQ